jgi:hypothetical protein
MMTDLNPSSTPFPEKLEGWYIIATLRSEATLFLEPPTLAQSQL